LAATSASKSIVRPAEGLEATSASKSIDNSSFEAFRRLNQERTGVGITVTQLARFGGVNPSWYRRCLREPELVTARTVSRLRIAMMRLRKRSGDGEAIVQARDALIVCGLMLALVCREYRLDVGKVRGLLAGGGERPRDADWLAASHARQLAIYLLHTGAGFSQPVVAQALGILKQTVSQAVRTVEDRREDAGFDALCDRLLNEAGVCDD
jgi:hypothetical protein